MCDTTRKPRAPALPKILKTPDSEQCRGLFWAACMLNDDAELQAIQQLRKQKSNCMAMQDALITAMCHIKTQVFTSAKEAHREGTLLFCFHGSKVFEVKA